ncbi:protein RGF1 INDUCIBLE TRANSCRIPTION FACTOR 1-like [Rutidosis leptorrhynchoides]|uniref:protein RGF1 INDUCIBLE TRANSCRIPTION FACTOR 1-like n=1 Tax=Rutidosis leptorrhynchoides TaxID=125765 RepID=UPI003A98D01C
MINEEIEDIPLTANGVEYKRGCYLADDIYPGWASFVKAFLSVNDEKRSYISKKQAAARKNIERTFDNGFNLTENDWVYEPAANMQTTWIERFSVDSSSSSPTLPLWLESLLAEKFYTPCLIHHDVKKNEKNIFCIDCCDGLCPHCIAPHGSHRLLQIRRYVYHDVIRVGDAEKLLDCSYVQPYINNSAKVVFLNARAQTRGYRNTNNGCISCDRALQEPYLFCSIFCKINRILRSEGRLSEYLHDCEVLTLPEPGFDDGLMTPDSVLEPFTLLRTSSGSSASYGAAVGPVDCRTINSTAEIVRKKRTSKPRTSCIPVVSQPVDVSANRRKGFPRRSPFH